MTFIHLKSNRFRWKDMELLSKHFLANSNCDFWVRRAAQTLLQKSTRSANVHCSFKDDEELPDFLQKFSQDIKTTQAKAEETNPYASSIQSVPEEDEAPEDSQESSRPVTTDILEKALSIRESLQNLEAQGDDDVLDKQLVVFRLASDLSAALDVIKPWEMQDEVTLLLASKLLGGNRNRGHSWSVIVMKAVLLPKLLSIQQQPASRVLMTAILQTSKSHPRAFVDAVLVPLMQSKIGVSVQQCEMIGRVVKESLQADVIVFLCQKLFCESRLGGSSALLWSEGMVVVVHTILNCRAQLDGGILSGLVMSLEVAAADLGSSLKFANLLLCLLTNYGSQLLKDHKECLEQMVLKTNNFMTRTLLSKLNTT